MTDELSNLESELASLQPPSLSADCLRHIDHTLATEHPVGRTFLSAADILVRIRRHPAITALAASLLLTATLAWIILSNPTPPETIAILPPPPTVQPLATLALYRQALARGPAALDALLDQQAAICLHINLDDKPLRAGSVSFPLSDN